MDTGALAAAPLPVLVVDDDGSLRGTLLDILEMHGFVPTGAQDGRSAIAEASRVGPSVAIVDLRLPDMDGIELARKLRAMDEAIQVVILTGNASVESAVRALRDEGCDYLVKPAPAQELIRTIGSAADRWRLHKTEANLRDTRAMLDAVFQASPLPLVAVAEDDTVQLWNPAAESVFGWTADEVRGQASPIRISQLIREDRGIVRAVLDGVAIRGEQVHGFTKAGKRLDLRISAAPLPDRAGRNAAVLAIFEDITFRKQLEAHLQQSQRLDAVGRLASGIAHDFNNLLGVVGNEVDLLLADGPDDPRILEGLENIARTTERGAVLTAQILGFARRQPTRSEKVGVNGVLRGIESMLVRLLSDRIALELDLDEAAGVVNVDVGKLEQVITNLVVNARDAIPGTGTITISSRADTGHQGVEAGATDWTIIHVTDTGQGIPEALLPRIFEPFFTTKAPGKGTGLGLATCHTILEEMGGIITVRSQAGQGTRFEIRLPRVAASLDRPFDPGGGAPNEPMRGSEEVLVVEDNPALLDVARRMLIRLGYSVHSASDGEEALAILTRMNAAPALIFTDTQLPAMDGIDLIRRVRSRNPAQRVLLTSGSVGADPAHRVGVPFLPKPYTLPGLAEAVRHAIDRPT